MKIIVTGATGFIGAAVVAALRRDGHEVAEAGRNAALPLDLARPDVPGWTERLRGADALVNCAGVFGDGGGQSAEAINHTGAAALFRACAAAGVRRVVQFSAIGVEDGLSAFARSKRAADHALMALDLDWVILRPGIVFAADAGEGGAALLRGLAALPALPLDPRAAALQVVQRDDVAAAVRRLVEPGAPSRVVIELLGPERLSFADTVQTVRRWLGWPPAPQWRLPGWLMDVGYALGDLCAWLGWKTPIRSDARREIARGAVGDHAALEAAAGFAPAPLSRALPPNGASVQDRLHAALYFLQPLVIGITALFFIGTGIMSIGPGYDIGVALLVAGGMGSLSGPSVIVGGLADIAAGLAIAWRPTARLGLYAGIALGLFYFAMGTILLPELWRDPIGPMLKIWPLLVLNLVGLAMVRDR